MEKMLWQKYPVGQISDKIKFWVDVWDDLITHFTRDHYGFEMANPHVLLNVLVDELQNNELRNSEVREYLLRNLGRSVKNDPSIRKNISSEFSLLLKSLNGGAKPYLIECTKGVLPFFQKGDYFRESFQRLRKIFSDSEWRTGQEEEIQSISSTLIVELVLKGYSLDTIKRMPRNIFSTTTDNFPSESPPDYSANLPPLELMIKAAEENRKIQSLGVEERVLAFERYFSMKEKEYLFIFEVEGITGEADLEIGPVTFYSPKSRSILNAELEWNQGFLEEEFFGREKNQYFCNAVIRLSCIDPEEGKIRGAEIGNKALDFLARKSSQKNSYRLVKEQYCWLSADGKFLSSGTTAGNEPRIIKWHSSENLKALADDKELREDISVAKEFLFLPKDKQSALEQKISDCIHWFRKGEESGTSEDRLLYYWIVIEKIFTFPSTMGALIKGSDSNEGKIFLITEFLSSTIAFNFVHRHAWSLYFYLSRLVNTVSGNPSESLLTLPIELAKKTYLQRQYQGHVFLKDLVANLEKIGLCAEDRIIKHRINDAIKFYNDGKFGLSEIQGVRQHTKDDILLIYRYRNSIVHNAHYDSTLLHPFVEKAASLARAALNLLIRERNKASPATVDKIFLADYSQLSLILERLEKNLPVDFLEVPSWNAKRPRPENV